jgi:hypothetical protein
MTLKIKQIFQYQIDRNRFVILIDFKILQSIEVD